MYRKEYMRKWRKENRGIVNAQKRRYYSKHRDKVREQNKRAEARHPERVKVAAKRYGQKAKSDALTYYGAGQAVCVRCSFSDIRALTIDHIAGGGHQHRISLKRGNIYIWLRLNNYPDGYQTLCMNCQLIKKEETGESARRFI